MWNEHNCMVIWTFLGIAVFHGSDGKASACNAEDPGSIPVSGRSPGEGNGNPLQYSCLENSMDVGNVHGVAKSRTQLSNVTRYFYTLGLKWKLTFSTPVTTAEFPKFADMLSAAFWQHHLLRFWIAHWNSVIPILLFILLLLLLSRFSHVRLCATP